MKTITNEILKSFELYLYDAERSENTMEKYIRDIRLFRKWLQNRGIDKPRRSQCVPKKIQGS